MKRICLALLRWILGPKLTAALKGGQAAYEAEDQKDQDAAVEANAAEIQQIHSRVEAKKDKAHEEVVSAADPDAVVNQQLRDLGLVAGDKNGDS